MLVCDYAPVNLKFNHKQMRTMVKKKTTQTHRASFTLGNISRTFQSAADCEHGNKMRIQLCCQLLLDSCRFIRSFNVNQN